MSTDPAQCPRGRPPQMRTTVQQHLTIHTGPIRSAVIRILQMGTLRLREERKPAPGHRARRRPQRKQGGHECLSSQGASALASWAAPVYPARHVCVQFYRNTVTLVHFNTACGTVALTKAEPRGGDRDRLAGNAAARPFAVCRLAKTDPASAPEALRGLLSSLSLRAERTFG